MREFATPIIRFLTILSGDAPPSHSNGDTLDKLLSSSIFPLEPMTRSFLSLYGRLN
jgi:hypothetical protein